MNRQDSEHKDVSDPSYGLSDLRDQLTGGGLRWLASVLGAASLGLLGYLISEGEKAKLDFPFRIEGSAALWTVGLALAFWVVIAVINWSSWFRKKGTR
jgi:hypothetical protein